MPGPAPCPHRHLRPAATDSPATMECPHDRPSHRAPPAVLRAAILRRRRRAVDALAGAGDGPDGACGRGAAGLRALTSAAAAAAPRPVRDAARGVAAGSVAASGLML